MDKYTLVFFDFDGVVLDSARIKTEAFPLVFDDYPQHAKAITEHHLANQGISRFKKFEWVYGELLKEPLTEQKSIELGEKFSEIVLEKVLKCDEIKGAIKFLDFLRSKKVTAVVASGTPYKELFQIIDKRNLSIYFNEVWGSPKKKTAIIKDILNRYHLNPEQALFLGDASTDYEAALENKVDFQAIFSPEMQEFWQSKGESTIEDLTELIPRFE